MIDAVLVFVSPTSILMEDLFQVPFSLSLSLFPFPQYKNDQKFGSLVPLYSYSFPPYRIFVEILFFLFVPIGIIHQQFFFHHLDQARVPPPIIIKENNNPIFHHSLVGTRIEHFFLSENNYTIIFFKKKRTHTQQP